MATAPADPPTLSFTCPAKINLALSVGGIDERGYHPIASWMVATAFGDQLRLTVAGEPGTSRFELSYAEDAPKGGEIDWPLEKDLAFRAHAAVEAWAGKPLPVEAKLRKSIPTGAGLGGGSSDAAGMIVGLERLFDLAMPTQDMHAVAVKLGCDVPFLVEAMRGLTSAITTGYGELLKPAPLASTLHFVLIFPYAACPTGVVYAAFDEAMISRSEKTPSSQTTLHLPNEDAVGALASLDPLPQDAPFNDLAKPACAAVPPLREAYAAASQALGIPVHITGSGSTMFAIAPSAITAQALSRKVTALTGMPAVATRSLPARG